MIDHFTYHFSSTFSCYIIDYRGIEGRESAVERSWILQPTKSFTTICKRGRVSFDFWGRIKAIHLFGRKIGRKCWSSPFCTMYLYTLPSLYTTYMCMHRLHHCTCQRHHFFLDLVVQPCITILQCTIIGTSVHWLFGTWMLTSNQQASFGNFRGDGTFHYSRHFRKDGERSHFRKIKAFLPFGVFGSSQRPLHRIQFHEGRREE